MTTDFHCTSMFGCIIWDSLTGPDFLSGECALLSESLVTSGVIETPAND